MVEEFDLDILGLYKPDDSDLSGLYARDEPGEGEYTGPAIFEDVPGDAAEYTGPAIFGDVPGDAAEYTGTAVFDCPDCGVEIDNGPPGCGGCGAEFE